MDTPTEFSIQSSISRQYELIQNQISQREPERFVPHGAQFQGIAQQDANNYVTARQVPTRISGNYPISAGQYSGVSSYQWDTYRGGVQQNAALPSCQLQTPGQDKATANNIPQSSAASTSGSEFRDPTVFVAPHLLRPMVVEPEDLDLWRERFFDIHEPLLLTEDQYLTYFPHVDNVYSHRSTQKYKRKPFVSHYWDCRLKGRPTGTPLRKNTAVEDGEEPERKKRKRKVRERDLCDVKIKVTEYFSAEEIQHLRTLGLRPQAGAGSNADEVGELAFSIVKANEGYSILEPAEEYPPDHPGANGKKWYMVQRVGGNDREGEDVSERDLDHKHTLAESDRVKKNSVQRWLIAQEKEKKKAAKDGIMGVENIDLNDEKTPGNTRPRLQASGVALQTLFNHMDSASTNLTFFGSSICPFGQRVWLALEHIGIPYRYVDVTERDFVRPADAAPDAPWQLNIPELLVHNPEGRVPCLLHNNFVVYESSAMLEYLEDLGAGPSLFPTASCVPQLKAHSRMWGDFINRRILPYFYALLVMPDNVARDLAGGVDCDGAVNLAQTSQRQEGHSQFFNHEAYQIPSSRKPLVQTRPSQNVEMTDGMVSRQSAKITGLLNTLLKNITTLVNASHRTGPYFMGPNLSYVDIAFAPWIIRLSRVMAYFRGFPQPEIGTRWQMWCDAIENNEIVRRTVSEEESYRAAYAAAAWQATEDGGLTTHWEYDKNARIRPNVALAQRNNFSEIHAAKRLIDAEGITWSW